MKKALIIALGSLTLAACTDAPDEQISLETPAALSEGTREILPTMMRDYGVDGMVVSVVSDQNILLSQGYGKTQTGEAYTATTPCSIYSATKAISAFTLASLIEDQAFDIDKPLSAYLHDAPDVWRDIHFWRLLNHTSGIPMIVNKPEFSVMADDPNAGNRDIYHRVKSWPLDYNPGEYSRYRQSGYAVAEMIFAQELGTHWHELVDAHVTGPAVTTATYNPKLHTAERTTPLLTSAGGFQTTAGDMTTIFRALNAGTIVSRTGLKTLMTNPQYNFNGYSLGVTISDVAGEPTMGHSGGGRANIRYAPGSGAGVFVCTDDLSNHAIMVDVAKILMREVVSGTPALLPVQSKLYALEDPSAADIAAAYEAAKLSSDPAFDFSMAEGVLNHIGYDFFRDKKLDDAIELFTLNVRDFPASPNVHDSLGEALFANEYFEQALVSYNRVLALNPGNRNAKAMIDKIKTASGQ